MSPMARTLLKIIFGVLAIYIVVAAVPIFQQAYQNLVLTPALPPKFVFPSETTSPATPEPVVPTTSPATPVPVTPTTSPAIPEPVVPTTSSATPEPVTPTTSPATPEPVAPTTSPSTPELVAPNAAALEPILTPELMPTSPDMADLLGQPIRLPGRIENYPNTYILTNLYRSVEFTYQVQPGTPIFIQNFAHAYAGCSWMSVAGQVLDANGEGLTYLVVSVKSTLNGSQMELLGLTGLAQEYGPGGYEIQLSNSPTASTGKLTIQVFDLNGNALTEPVQFDTSAGCSENVVLINFAP